MSKNGYIFLVAPPHYQIITVQECRRRWAAGGYDACAWPVKNGKANTNIFLEQDINEVIPEDATHIAWFNR